MITKQFQDVAVDEEFVAGGLRYKKIAERRISCCRSINACLVDNAATQTQFTPMQEVEVDEQK